VHGAQKLELIAPHYVTRLDDGMAQEQQLIGNIALMLSSLKAKQTACK